MAEFKLTIADPKTGKCVQKAIEGDVVKNITGMKVGETLKGEAVGLEGYEFVITGGSDFCGFPMRKGIQGARKKILIKKGVGFKGAKKGIRRRKTVCGESVSDNISQINLKITKYGKAKLEAGEKKEGESPAEGEEGKEAAPPAAEQTKEKGGKEAPKEAAPAEEKKEEPPKAEEKPAEKKEGE